MKKLYFLILLVLGFCTATAQEKLSKEEQARRDKNIQAGNPFVKFGSKAPVATLSKGKYLEVHDLDSIVTIGTTRWLVEEEKIVGDIILDTLNPDAQPIGDIAGRWISQDPLSEEFSEWSPYQFVNGNPIRYNDPTGMAPEDCCDGLKGFLIGMSDNILGRSDRSNYGGQDFNNGAKAADVLSLVGGSFLAAKGVLDMGTGASGLSSSAAVTAGTGGLAIEVTAPAALASAGILGLGIVETTIGGNIANNAKNNLESGSSSGKTGTGRGSNNRTADKDAVGDHTVRNENGSTTYKVEPNNPNKNNKGLGFKTEKRVDYKGAAHVDRKTGIKTETPHVQQNGNVRPAIPGKDMPRNLKK